MGNIEGTNMSNITQVPDKILEYPDECNRYGIQVAGQFREKSKDTSVKFIDVKFPPYWSTKVHGTYFTQYLDENNIPCIGINCKTAMYDEFVYIQFYSDEEKNMFKQDMLKQTDLQNIYDNYIKENFTQEWSPENRFICYYFRDNSYRANSYYAGCIPLDPDYKIEFHEHKLIGFTNNYDNITKFLEFFKTNNIKEIIKYSKVVIRELPNGVSNLHRFEIYHMLGYDPNLNTKTQCYDASKFKQKKISSKQDIFDLY